MDHKQFKERDYRPYWIQVGASGKNKEPPEILKRYCKDCGLLPYWCQCNDPRVDWP